MQIFKKMKVILRKWLNATFFFIFFQPAGLLVYLHSADSTPTREVDRLHVRDNLKMAITDAESNRGNVLLRAAGQGLKQGKEIASKTAEVVTEKTAKYTTRSLAA